MKSKRKSNGHPVVRADGAKLDPMTEAVLTALEKGEPPEHPDPDPGPGVIPDPLPIARPAKAPEAAVLHFGPNDSALFAKWSSRKSPLNEGNWLAVCRYQPKTLAHFVAVEARKFAAPLTADAIASLEACVGNDYDHGHADIPAELAELEGCATVTNAKNGSWRLWVKHRGLWHAVGLPVSRTNKYEPSHNDKERQRLREQGHPDICYV